MNRLVTRCPSCRAAFRVTRGQIETAAGRVRCGVCLNAFDAMTHRLVPRAISGVAADNPPHAGTSDTRSDTLSAFDVAQDGIGDRVEPRFNSGFSVKGRDQPDFPAAHPAQTARGSRQTSRQVMIALACVLGIAGQYIYFHLDILSQQQGARRWLEAVCDVLHCSLPPRRDVAMIKSQSVVVKSHPTVAGALRMDAVIINQAAFEQPFPQLLVIFRDLQGKVVARRRLTPEEYLHGEMADVSLMPSQRSIQLQLDFVDPGPSAISYSLDPL